MPKLKTGELKKQARFCFEFIKTNSPHNWESLSNLIVLLPSKLKLYLSKETIEYCITDTKVLFIQG